MSKITHLYDLIEFPKDGVLSKTISETASGDVDIFMLPKGEKISGHTASRDAAVQILKGEADFRLGPEWYHVVPGDWFLMEAGLEHELKSTEDLVFLLTLFGA